MRGTQRGWPALTLLAALLAGTAQAGPYLGDWGWCWHQEKGCPKGDYCFLHYWTPVLYQVKYCLHPAHIQQAPPGVPVPLDYLTFKFPCRTLAPMPPPAYSDPAGYYGRAVLPPAGQGQSPLDVAPGQADSGSGSGSGAGMAK
jgi:hypothetical protein